MNTKTERNWQLIVAGILFIIFGLVCAFFPGLTLASIAFIVGAAFVVSGVVNIATFMVKRAGLPLWGWMLFSGVISIVIGFMFFSMPEMLALFIALFALLRGVDLIVMGANARKYFL